MKTQCNQIFSPLTNIIYHLYIRDVAMHGDKWIPACQVATVVVKIRNEESLNNGNSSGNEWGVE